MGDIRVGFKGDTGGRPGAVRHFWWFLKSLWRHRWYLKFYAPWNEGRPGRWYCRAPWHVWLASVLVGGPLKVGWELVTYMHRWLPRRPMGFVLDLDHRFNKWADSRSTGWAWMSPLGVGVPEGYTEVGFHYRDDLLPPRRRDADGYSIPREAEERPQMFVQVTSDPGVQIEWSAR